MPYDSPLPRVNTLGSDEGSMTLQELRVLCTTLSKKVESLETDLKQTKQLYGTAFTRLIKKVKKLEKTTKSNQARRRARIVVSDDEDDLEDPSKQGRKIAKIDQDPDISLVQHDAEIQGRYIQGRYGHEMEFKSDFDVAKEVSIAEKYVSTAKPFSTAGGAAVTAASIRTASPTKVSTADDITLAETLVYIKNMGSYTLKQLRVDRTVPELAAKSSKKVAKEELDQESSKRQKTGESSELAEELRDKEADELS
ncbi:hypothetical protein Tco_1553045 [Tanacetum coccineum]